MTALPFQAVILAWMAHALPIHEGDNLTICFKFLATEFVHLTHLTESTHLPKGTLQERDLIKQAWWSFAYCDPCGLQSQGIGGPEQQCLIYPPTEDADSAGTRQGLALIGCQYDTIICCNMTVNLAREITPRLERTLGRLPVVVLSGLRQTDKSMLLQHEPGRSHRLSASTARRQRCWP